MNVWNPNPFDRTAHLSSIWWSNPSSYSVRLQARIACRIIVLSQDSRLCRCQDAGYSQRDSARPIGRGWGRNLRASHDPYGTFSFWTLIALITFGEAVVLWAPWVTAIDCWCFYRRHSIDIKYAVAAAVYNGRLHSAATYREPHALMMISNC